MYINFHSISSIYTILQLISQRSNSTKLNEMHLSNSSSLSSYFQVMHKNWGENFVSCALKKSLDVYHTVFETKTWDYITSNYRRAIGYSSFQVAKA